MTLLSYTLGHLGSHLYSFPQETYLGFVELNRSKEAMIVGQRGSGWLRSCGKQVAQVGTDQAELVGWGIESMVASPLCALYLWLFGFYVV